MSRIGMRMSEAVTKIGATGPFLRWDDDDDDNSLAAFTGVR